jgi:pSer/pThr/pTyr-binding forkhead associated (FHA) protein
VLTLRELRRLVMSMTEEDLLRQLGPFVLIQRPPEPEAAAATRMMGLPPSARTTQVARSERVTTQALSILFEFDDLRVATLPPVDGEGALSVGRLPDCDLVLDDASVSKRHAALRWESAAGLCTLEDLGSTNGTFLNAATRLRGPVALRDGDIVSFGEVPFWYLITSTLYARLRDLSATRRGGLHSG